MVIFSISYKTLKIYEDFNQISNDFIWFIFEPYHTETPDSIIVIL